MGLGIGIGDAICVYPRRPSRFSLGLGLGNHRFRRFLSLATREDHHCPRQNQTTCECCAASPHVVLLIIVSLVLQAS
jgi:hypothetical protein